MVYFLSKASSWFSRQIRFSCLFLLLLIGCKSPSSDSLITVAVFGNVPGARQLAVVPILDSGERMGTEMLFPKFARSQDLSFPTDLSLRMPVGLSGRAVIRISALSESGSVLATATSDHVDFGPGRGSAVSVCFDGMCPVDASVLRDAAASDVAFTDASDDRNTPRDGAPIDAAAIADGSVRDGGDGSVIDGAARDGGDGAATDGAVTDAATPDGSIRDAASPDASACGPLGCYICQQPGWCPLPQNGRPSGRSGHSAIWTGSEMVIWGGSDKNGTRSDGYRWNATTRAWSQLPPLGISARTSHNAVWTGREMILFGGTSDGNYTGELSDGYLINPTTGAISAMDQTNAPANFGWVSRAVWTGSEVVLWGGLGVGDTLHKWNPATGWTQPAQSNVPYVRQAHSAVWTDAGMIIFGGYQSGALQGGPHRWSPVTGAWDSFSQPTGTPPSARSHHSGVWTGSELLLWGGYGSSLSGYLNDGYRFNPVSNSWTEISQTQGPSPRYGHVAVWTGYEMIIWGGVYYDANAVPINRTRYLDDGYVWRP